MKFLSKILLLAIGLCLALSLQAQTNDQLPPKREFRCSWLTTVWAIDWPLSHSRTDAAGQQKQQEELIAIVDSLAKANMNAVLFQVRGFSDAMYNSKYEPWSRYLTGTRGKAPSYDPLALLVDYAHYKGIEVHVWLNPYRYSSSSDTYGKNHEKDYHNTHLDWLVDCGGITILNPALPEVREQICKVVADIVEKYDIDGVIFDDYFHQDGYKNEYDDVQYNAYKDTASSVMSRADWRRAQNNLMIRMVNDTIKAIKPWVTFGLGPAGKAGASADKYGVEPSPIGGDWQYNGIYADPLAWYNEHTIDYMAPQVYWKIGSSSDYDQLTRWWSDMAAHFGRHMYVSQSLSAMVKDDVTTSSSSFHASEIVDQIKLNRRYDRFGAPGFCWYGLKMMRSVKTFIGHIRDNATYLPALVPQMTWYRTDDCLYVSNIQDKGSYLIWDAPADNLRYAVYAIPTNKIGQIGAAGTSQYLLGTTYMNTFELEGKEIVTGTPVTFAVAVLDRFGNEFPARTMDNTVWGKSDATSLLYPANNDTQVLLPCYASWKAVPEADSYFFQLSKSADFSTVDYEYETMDTTFFLGTIYWLDSEETYYWRVRTRSINKEDTYSDISAFSGAFFHVVYPAEGDTVQTLTPTLVCDSVAMDKAEYTFEVATAQTFGQKDIIYTGESASPRITLPDSILMPSRNYYVRATVKFSNVVVMSDVRKFRTLALPVPVPVIISPTSGEIINANSVTVKWQNQVSSGYQVEFSQSATFPNRSTKRYRVDSFTHEYTYNRIADGVWYVRVEAAKEGGWTEYSEVVSFTIDSSMTDVENPTISTTPTKVIENGQVVIYRNGQRYSLLGNKAQ